MYIWWFVHLDGLEPISCSNFIIVGVENVPGTEEKWKPYRVEMNAKIIFLARISFGIAFFSTPIADPSGGIRNAIIWSDWFSLIPEKGKCCSETHLDHWIYSNSRKLMIKWFKCEIFQCRADKCNQGSSFPCNCKHLPAKTARCERTKKYGNFWTWLKFMWNCDKCVCSLAFIFPVELKCFLLSG